MVDYGPRGPQHLIVHNLMAVARLPITWRSTPTYVDLPKEGQYPKPKGVKPSEVVFWACILVFWAFILAFQAFILAFWASILVFWAPLFWSSGPSLWCSGPSFWPSGPSFWLLGFYFGLLGFYFALLGFHFLFCVFKKRMAQICQRSLSKMVTSSKQIQPKNCFLK